MFNHVSHYQPQRWFINGSSGPWSPRTPEGRGANTGRTVSQLMQSGRYDILANSDIQYTTIDPRTGKYSISGGMAYSQESLRGADTNRDGRVSIFEIPMGQYLDLNHDGQINALENYAYTNFQDINKNGILSPEEITIANQQLASDPSWARGNLQAIANHAVSSQSNHSIGNFFGGISKFFGGVGKFCGGISKFFGGIGKFFGL